MTIIKRAFLSVVRRKGKSLILFAIVLILGNIIAGAIAVEQATKQVEQKVKKDLGSTATVTLDFENNQEALMDEKTEIKDLSLEQIKKIGALPYVDYYDYQCTAYYSTKKLKTVIGENKKYGGSQAVSLTGGNTSEIFDIKEKKIKLVAGRHFTEQEIKNGKNVAVISSQLATENGVSIGDQLVVDAQGLDYDESGESKIHFTEDIPIQIIGLFEVVNVEKKTTKKAENSDESMNQHYLLLERLNTIYVPNEFILPVDTSYNQKLAKLEGDSEQVENPGTPAYTPLYVLKKADDLPAFKQEAQAFIPKLYMVSGSADQYEEIGANMQKMGKLAQLVVLLAVAATLTIVSLVILLFIRERRHEMGIYLALGEKRGHITAQLVLEMLVIASLALMVSLATGQLLGQQISQSLLSSEMFSSKASTGQAQAIGYLFQSTVSSQDVAEAYRVTFSVRYMFTYLLTGLGTVLLATILPIVYLLRLNPKKIML